MGSPLEFDLHMSNAFRKVKKVPGSNAFLAGNLCLRAWSYYLDNIVRTALEC